MLHFVNRSLYSMFISFQFTAQCWYETETAGSLVFPGSFLLPASQTLHPGCAGGSGKPSVQQQEDRTYPNKAYVQYDTRHKLHFCLLILTELQENYQWKQFKLYLRNWGKKVNLFPLYVGLLMTWDIQVCVFWHQGTWSGWIRTSRGV